MAGLLADRPTDEVRGLELRVPLAKGFNRNKFVHGLPSTSPQKKVTQLRREQTESRRGRRRRRNNLRATSLSATWSGLPDSLGTSRACRARSSRPDRRAHPRWRTLDRTNKSGLVRVTNDGSRKRRNMGKVRPRNGPCAITHGRGGTNLCRGSRGRASGSDCLGEGGEASAALECERRLP